MKKEFLTIGSVIKALAKNDLELDKEMDKIKNNEERDIFRSNELLKERDELFKELLKFPIFTVEIPYKIRVSED